MASGPVRIDVYYDPTCPYSQRAVSAANQYRGSRYSFQLHNRGAGWRPSEPGWGRTAPAVFVGGTFLPGGSQALLDLLGGTATSEWRWLWPIAGAAAAAAGVAIILRRQ